MQFFPIERWERLQDGGDPTIDKEWEEAFVAYGAQLDLLRQRLSEDAFFFFRFADVHDGELMELTVMDGSRPAPLSEEARPWASPRAYPVQVNLKVLDAWDRFLWAVSYTGVRRLVTNFPDEKRGWYQDGEGFGDWGYHELCAVDEVCLRHEILFASGSTLLIEFDRVVVSVKKVRGTGPLPFYRSLTDWERGLILHMLTAEFPGRDLLVQQIDRVLGSPDGNYYDDGGLLLRTEPQIRIPFKNRVLRIEGESSDTDGSTIHYGLDFLDGEIRRLDIYKANQSRVIRHPDFKEIQVKAR
jgi:hypothetical protein